MPHQVHLRKLSRESAHRRAMLRGLAASVLRYERVRTTEARGKEVRRLVERSIGLARDGGLLARRRARAMLGDPLVVEKLFAELAPRYADRPSGHTRLVRLGHRVGDGAPMVLVELVEGKELTAPEATEPEEAAEKGPSRGERARQLTRSLAAGGRKAGGGRQRRAGKGEEAKKAPRGQKDEEAKKAPRAQKDEKKEGSATRRGKEKSERP